MLLGSLINNYCHREKKVLEQTERTIFIPFSRCSLTRMRNMKKNNWEWFTNVLTLHYYTLYHFCTGIEFILENISGSNDTTYTLLVPQLNVLCYYYCYYYYYYHETMYEAALENKPPSERVTPVRVGICARVISAAPRRAKIREKIRIVDPRLQSPLSRENIMYVSYIIRL